MKYLVDLLAKVSCSRYMWLFKFLALAYTHGELENISCENWGFDLVLEENPDGYFSRTERVAVEEFIRIRCKMPNLFCLSDSDVV